jgi:hypothetical protein
VVDSTDSDRLEIAAEELHKLLLSGEYFSINSSLLKRIEDVFDKSPLLIFANKRDMKKVVSIDEIVSKLKLDQLGNRLW